LILESARKAAEAERELNDFIAHEVRNPVAAAMSACSFVKAALNRKNPLSDEESQTTTREDVHIIDNALKFVNDLLRNMLDMHRAANKQLKVTLSPCDILHDVLEPVQAMLIQRGGKVDVEISCPDNMFAMADRLRLKQVMLNLGRNSAKFVDEGFIRLSATPFQGDHVQIAVEDSGPGIPIEKKKLLFQKYQESLDMLSQGTVSIAMAVHTV
jgi:signal transduction histidine kinase